MRSSGSSRDAPLDFGWTVAGRPTGSAGSVVVVLVAAGAADHDLVLLDRDLDGPMAGPVLCVDGVVLDRGVKPETVALLAVVKRPLERPGGALASACARPRARALRSGVGLRLLGGLGLGGLARRLLGGLRLLLRAPDLLGLELRRDRLVVGHPQVDLVDRARIRAAVAIGLQAMLALERLDLLDGDL